MGKITGLAAMAAGYVLGARAGRERYEQIRHQASKVWNNPTVSQKRSEATGAAASLATDAASSAGEAAKNVAGTAGQKLRPETRGSAPDSKHS